MWIPFTCQWWLSATSCVTICILWRGPLKMDVEGSAAVRWTSGFVHAQLQIMNCHSVSLFWWCNFSSGRYTKGARAVFISVLMKTFFICRGVNGKGSTHFIPLLGWGGRRFSSSNRALKKNLLKWFLCPSCPLRTSGICRELEPSVRGVWTSAGI